MPVYNGTTNGVWQIRERDFQSGSSIGEGQKATLDEFRKADVSVPNVCNMVARQRLPRLFRFLSVYDGFRFRLVNDDRKKISAVRG